MLPGSTRDQSRIPTPMNPFEINVTGHGTCIYPAERVLLELEAKAESQTSQAEASSAVIATANVARDMLNPHYRHNQLTGEPVVGSPIEFYLISTTRPSVSTEPNSSQTAEKLTTYTAQCTINIKFKDFELLNRLATDFSSMKNIRILRVVWYLIDGTIEHVSATARKRAAEDAVAKAADYAVAFAGATRTRLRPTSVQETKYNVLKSRPVAGRFRVSEELGGPPAATWELQYEPEDVRVEVQVSAKFGIAA
jgi:uncharacterized protein YggE